MGRPERQPPAQERPAPEDLQLGRGVDAQGGRGAALLGDAERPGAGTTSLPTGAFLMIQRSEAETSTREIRVVLNWFEELKRRLPR